ncbi:MAG: DUF1461 domain-containing protein [Bermanella sp.]
MAKVNFGYALLHDVMDIQQHSHHYGPQNRHRHGFQYTSKGEHIRLFAEINSAIHNQGKGLAEIQYHHPNGKVIDRLLHRAEVIHLQDVANLLSTLTYLGGAATCIWLMLALIYRFNLVPEPNLKQHIGSMVSLLAFSALAILIIGPVKVFYRFHEWVFPPDHQWFFYYQDSLMTILMKAPDLFGAIAILMTALAVLIFIALNLALHYLKVR